MFKASQRRVSYYWSLPIVVAIAALTVVKLAAMQRAELIGQLKESVAHQSTEEATAAVRHLASLPRPPVDVLVWAAASPNHYVAKEAQSAIENWLRRCQRRIKSGEDVSTISVQLAALANALAREQTSFSVVDEPWIIKTTHHLARLANQLPPGDTPALAAHCETILASCARTDVAMTAFTAESPGTTTTLTSSPPAQLGAPTEKVCQPPQRPTSPGRHDEEFLSYPGLPFAAIEEIMGSLPRPDAPPLTPEPIDEAAPAMGQPLPESAFATSPDAGRLSSSVPSIGTEGSAGTGIDRAEGDWRPRWSPPLFVAAPAMPIHALNAPYLVERHDLPAPSAGAPPVGGLSAEPLAQVDTRELMRRWLGVEQGQSPAVEEELARRGFGRLTPGLVKPLLSADIEPRLRLIDSIFAQPDIDARPWLYLLAEDANADVRLVAVTVMATSSDAQLLERAWQVTIRDRDPRIASLAGPLRERRDRAQQR